MSPIARLAAALGAALLLVAGAGVAGPAATPAPDESTETPGAESVLAPPAAPGAERVVGGDPFPALVLKALRPETGRLEPLDLSAVIGKQPVVFVYVSLGSGVSEEILVEVQDLVRSELKGAVALYPAVRLGKRWELTELIERASLLRITEPIVVDEDGLLQRAIGAGVVPDITLIDAKGIVAFTHGVSLKHMILEPVDVAESLRLAARGEEVPQVIGLMRHHPAKDLVGAPFRDATLPEIRTGATVRIADHVRPGRMTAIYYWSPGCRFSRKVTPGVVVAERSYGGRLLDVLSVVRDGDRGQIEAYASETGMTFPILRDSQRRFTQGYRVVSTPTLILIRPDGVVDSVYTSGNENLFTAIQSRLKANGLRAAPPAKAPAAAAPPSTPG